MDTNNSLTTNSLTKTDTTLARCRMYKKTLPEVGDLVMVRVDRVDTDLAGYVELLEYDNREAVVLLSELCSKRIRRLKAHLQVGKHDVMQVLRVDVARGYVDLTKKNLQPEEITSCSRRYQKSKAVHGILSHVASILPSVHPDDVDRSPEDGLNKTLERLYETAVWPLYESYSHPYKAFKEAARSETDIFEGFEVSPDTRALIIKNIKHRLGLHPVKIQAEIQVTVYGYEGIDGIKASLKAGQQTAIDAQVPVKILLVKSPNFSLSVVSADIIKATEVINSAIRAIQTQVVKYEGQCIIASPPSVVA